MSNTLFGAFCGGVVLCLIGSFMIHPGLCVLLIGAAVATLSLLID